MEPRDDLFRCGCVFVFFIATMSFFVFGFPWVFRLIDWYDKWLSTK